MSVGEKKNTYFDYKERSVKRFNPIRPQFNIFQHFFFVWWQQSRNLKKQAENKLSKTMTTGC